MLTTATTVLGLTPLLFERSQQAQFLKPTVITLVYGLGFGMVLVLLVVPALLAMQRDVRRNTAALRRALRCRHGFLRGLVVASGLAILAWFAGTIGLTLVAGALPGAFLQVFPALSHLTDMTAAFVLYAGGTAMLIGLVLLTAAAGLPRRYQPDGQP